MKIIFPWLNNTDWTKNIFDAIQSDFNDKIICIDRDVDLSSGGFLINKSRTTAEIISSDVLSNASIAIFIDTTFIDFRIIKMYYPDCKLIGLVNGGEFQQYGFSYQLSPQDYQRVLQYENSLLSYLDVIILPSQFALRQFTEVHKNLAEKSIFCWLPLGNLPDISAQYARSDRKGMCYCGRPSYEKGYDIIREFNEADDSIDIIFGERKDSYYNKLSSHKYAIFPSREELYGYGVIESLFLGVIPIVPHSLSYQEITYLPHYLSDLSVPSIQNAIHYYESLSDRKRNEIVRTNQRRIIELVSGPFSFINTIRGYL
ncbi:hypothetical protein [Cedecea neteri]|uniref:hypothetical protein n=1 Tax=Cedecea neteri TaxID=158822 RepID=UPI0004F5DA60|nr:hypothetical protein [Cedecea neteri]AIR64301.1 hypothetical protein LH86_04150 [Cedecea neteri]